MKMMQNIAMVIFGIIISFVFIEVLLYVFPQLLPHDIFTYRQFVSRDFELVHKLRPNANITLYNGEKQAYALTTTSLGFDNIGFRDDGINAGKTLSIALGDSFTLGLGVNGSEAWPEILEQRSNLDVVNMGMFAHATYNEFKVLEKYGLKLNPKIVFLTFYTNDVVDNYLVQRNFDFGPLYYLHSFAVEHSNIYKWFSIERGLAQAAVNNTFCFGEYCDNYKLSVLEDGLRENQVGIALTKKYMSQIADIAKQSNITLVIILIPSIELVYYDKLGLDGAIYKKDYPVSDLVEFCRERGFTCIDLTRRLKEEVESNNKIFISNDGHLNAYGNEVIADEIQKYLIENKIVEK